MHVLTGRQSGRPPGAGRRLLMLGSNDYLGLASEPAVIEGAIAALQAYGTGHAMNQPFATTPLHQALRERIAAFTGTEAALLFASCTAANIALLTTLGAEGVILSDADNHASIVDGCRLARGRTEVYRSRDIGDLERALAETEGRRTIVSDGVFSVEGGIAPGRALADAAMRAGVGLVLDESHAAGVIGRGTAEACGLDPAREVTAFTGTFAKAFGAGGGGYVAGPAALMDEVRRAARFYIFSTGMHVAAVGAALAGIDMAKEEARRARLRDNTARLRGGLSAAGFTLLGGATPITPILIGDEDKARRFAQALAERGVVAPAMTWPIVPRGQARLRLQPSAAHTAQDIDEACAILMEVATQLDLHAGRA